jgi:hypothetical protein
LIDPIRQIQCNRAGNIYVPFYMRNDAYKLALDPEPFEGAITADLIKNKDCFECSQIYQLVNNERTHILLDNMSCQTNDDCTTNWANTSLRGGCEFIINKKGNTLLKDWVKKWDDMITKTNQSEFHNTHCGYATPSCMLVSAKCEQGRCVARSMYETNMLHTVHIDEVLEDPPQDLSNGNKPVLSQAPPQ